MLNAPYLPLAGVPHSFFYPNIGASFKALLSVKSLVPVACFVNLDLWRARLHFSRARPLLFAFELIDGFTKAHKVEALHRLARLAHKRRDHASAFLRIVQAISPESGARCFVKEGVLFRPDLESDSVIVTAREVGVTEDEMPIRMREWLWVSALNSVRPAVAILRVTRARA